MQLSVSYTLLVLVVSLLLQQQSFVLASERAVAEDCSVAVECQMCSSSDKKNIPECDETGIVQTLICQDVDGGM